MDDWNTLVREHSAAIFGIAWRVLGHAQDAEDVVQEVFVQARKQREQRLPSTNERAKFTARPTAISKRPRPWRFPAAFAP